MYLQAKILSLIKRTLAKDRIMSRYWKNDLPPTTKRFEGPHTDNVLENVFFLTQRGSSYELVVFLGYKPSADSFL